MASRSYSFDTQSIGLESVVNARDLGGYVLPDGSTVRRGLLLRGGSLAKATAADLDKLSKSYGLAYVFDFRTKMEIKHDPDMDVPGAKYTWLPAIDPDTDKLDQQLPPSAYRDLGNFLQHHASEAKVQDVARRLYSDMLFNEYTQLQYAAFMQTLVNTSSGAVFWHCSQGKDRTGLAAAFILTALGADRKLVVEDYAISNEVYAGEIAAASERMLDSGGGEEELQVIRTFIGANVEYFSSTLDLIDRNFGSLHQYVKDVLFVSEADMEVLRRRYLV